MLRQGRIVEEGPLARLMTTQAHAYTQTLFKEAVSRERNTTRGQAVVQALGISLLAGKRSKELQGWVAKADAWPGRSSDRHWRAD